MVDYHAKLGQIRANGEMHETRFDISSLRVPLSWSLARFARADNEDDDKTMMI